MPPCDFHNGGPYTPTAKGAFIIICLRFEVEIIAGYLFDLYTVYMRQEMVT